MMGERDPQKQLWSYQVNLDKRVRSDHPLRRINETLELDFVRREVAKFYGTKGNVSDTFLCPAGQVMKPSRLRSVRLSWEYVPKRGVCLSCRLREFCTRSKTGRSIKRHRDQNLLDRARRQANTQRARLDRKRRQHLMERSFADAANRHGFKRARWRGLVKQSIQDLLNATIQNLRKLIGAIQDIPQSAWKPLIRTLSWLCVMLSTLLTPDPPGQLVLAP